MHMKDLSKKERLQLMRFVCSFAWADFEVQPEEREYVKGLVRKLHLSDDEREQVWKWLEVPPLPDDVDPTEIPRKHRELFLDAVNEVVMADGVLAPEERENLKLFKELLG